MRQEYLDIKILPRTLGAWLAQAPAAFPRPGAARDVLKRAGCEMASYDRRDLIGHWVRRRQPEQQMCRHACCRGRRVHPANMPVILPDRLLRRASDEDLAEHYRRVTRGHTAEDEAAMYQVLSEMERRDEAHQRRQEAATRRRAAVFHRKLEHQEAIEHAWLQAEAATNGNMLSKRGRALGISERSLFTGSETRARRYASEELLNHWQTHPRPTAAMMRGEDTRLGPQYTPPKRRRHPYYARRRAA